MAEGRDPWLWRDSLADTTADIHQEGRRLSIEGRAKIEVRPDGTRIVREVEEVTVVRMEPYEMDFDCGYPRRRWWHRLLRRRDTSGDHGRVAFKFGVPEKEPRPK